MGYFGATLTQVFTCTHGADVSLRDVTIAQMGNGATECGWRHAPEACEGFGGFWKSQLVELSPASEENGWLSLGRRGLGQVPHGMGGSDEKARIERMCLSPCVEEPLNSKVIKSFVPELRSRKCFSCFEIPMFYVYMLRTFWTFCVPVWICPFQHIRIWLWYIIVYLTIRSQTFSMIFDLCVLSDISRTPSTPIYYKWSNWFLLTW